VIDKGMVVLQNYMDLQKDVPGLCSEMCLSSSHDENQVINIKVEATDIQEDEHPMLITFPVIKAEHKVSCISVRFHKYPELLIVFLMFMSV
jgi:hypothetical protein